MKIRFETWDTHTVMWMMQTKFNSVEFISTYVSAPNRYFHQGTWLTQLPNRLQYLDLNCLRLETERTSGFEALVKISQFAKHLCVLYTIPSREGGTKDWWALKMDINCEVLPNSRHQVTKLLKWINNGWIINNIKFDFKTVQDHNSAFPGEG